ncbi:MAG: transcriptional regulator [Deltaproteobacteria bacterium]|jgi:hypothetical protein|nr:transcriptional regulator [Deltaproteobacteria bacterium]
MPDRLKSLNDVAWEKLFEKYDILNQIEAKGRFEISAPMIKEFREPRLMAKFDQSINLPKIFQKNNLSILPISRGEYVISHFDVYHRFDSVEVQTTKVSLPAYIQSLNSTSITSESLALNLALASGIIAQFLEDESIVPTVSGRMGSGCFTFNIWNKKEKAPFSVQVTNSQIEIDAGYEGIHGLALFEAKLDIAEDFLVRQLYYPYRLWQPKIPKNVRSVFLVYSNGIYSLYEYAFDDILDYGSLALKTRKNYSIDDTSIELSDIQNVFRKLIPSKEHEIPFPQADSFPRVINLCELLYPQDLNRNDITERYAFDARQTNYYTDAARYLGLIEKRKDTLPLYSLSDTGKRVLNMPYKERQLAYCACILSHIAFGDTFRKYLVDYKMPSTDEIIGIMKGSDLYNIESESTFKRRASTIKSWVNWIINLTKT